MSSIANDHSALLRRSNSDTWTIASARSDESAQDRVADAARAVTGRPRSTSAHNRAEGGAQTPDAAIDHMERLLYAASISGEKLSNRQLRTIKNGIAAIRHDIASRPRSFPHEHVVKLSDLARFADGRAQKEIFELIGHVVDPMITAHNPNDAALTTVAEKLRHAPLDDASLDQGSVGRSVQNGVATGIGAVGFGAGLVGDTARTALSAVAGGIGGLVAGPVVAIATGNPLAIVGTPGAVAYWFQKKTRKWSAQDAGVERGLGPWARAAQSSADRMKQKDPVGEDGPLYKARHEILTKIDGHLNERRRAADAARLVAPINHARQPIFRTANTFVRHMPSSPVFAGGRPLGQMDRMAGQPPVHQGIAATSGRNGPMVLEVGAAHRGKFDKVRQRNAPGQDDLLYAVGGTLRDNGDLFQAFHQHRNPSAEQENHVVNLLIRAGNGARPINLTGDTAARNAFFADAVVATPDRDAKRAIVKFARFAEETKPSPLSDDLSRNLVSTILFQPFDSAEPGQNAMLLSTGYSVSADEIAGMRRAGLVTCPHTRNPVTEAAIPNRLLNRAAHEGQILELEFKAKIVPDMFTRGASGNLMRDPIILKQAVTIRSGLENLRLERGDTLDKTEASDFGIPSTMYTEDQMLKSYIDEKTRQYEVIG